MPKVSASKLKCVINAMERRKVTENKIPRRAKARGSAAEPAPTMAFANRIMLPARPVPWDMRATPLVGGDGSFVEVG